MLTLLEDLVIDRVDLVDEGANSAAFIELFKRKEQCMKYSEILSKMKPEHATVVQKEVDDAVAQVAKAKEDLDAANATISEQATQLTEANEALAKAKEDLAKAKEDLAKANEELETLKAKGSEACECDGEADEEGVCRECGKPKKVAKDTGFDETEVIKSMPENIRETYLKMREQKEAAEEMVRKNAEEKAEAEAVAKAATLKSLPVEQEVLVGIIKSTDQSVFDVLAAAATAVDEAVLGEVGKSRPNGPTAEGEEAWNKIEAEADKVVKRDNVSKQKAISIVIKEQPELYKSYLKGGTE